ncbi:hypothetical protein Q5P01_018826 [Channa striata]|uniref:CCHC-type domain-containing protein n=1 Tax=Channa striata TaxID=64152 RepID=A0AA88M5Q5_CHASR|nr:hypothetical protein Q5P01_018826 [Channa striata]
MSVGRGRGVLMCTPLSKSTPGEEILTHCIQCPEKAGAVGLKDDVVRLLPFSPVMSPVSLSQRLAQSDDKTFPSQITELARQIGAEIGDSIRTSLLQNVAQSPVVIPDQAQHVTHSDQCGTTFIDASKLNLVLRSEVNAPPYFRGDSSYKHSISEWEGLMHSYLSKLNLSGTRGIEEVINRLMGKARDIIKVWLRSNPDVNDVNIVFAVLRRHFGEVVQSDLPLADFYAVRPLVGEVPLDYWIRLNKAAELAEQSLVSRGEPVADLGRQAVIMFVRNCPDKELALIFKTRSPREWSAREVQEHLDDLERLHTVCGFPVSVRKQTATGLCQEGMISGFRVDGPKHDVTTTPDQTTVTDDKSSMDKLLSLLERNLSCNAQGVRIQPQRKSYGRTQGCRVYNGPDHSTNAHCRMDRLCFKCYSPGHISAHCRVPPSTQSQSGAPDAPNQGN